MSEFHNLTRVHALPNLNPRQAEGLERFKNHCYKMATVQQLEHLFDASSRTFDTAITNARTVLGINPHTDVSFTHSINKT